MILFTSGTTGRPKGATLTHRNLVHMGSAMAFGRAVAMLLNNVPPPAPDAPPPASICATPFFHISGTAPLFMTRVALRVDARVPAARSVGPGDAPATHRRPPGVGVVGGAHAVLAHARAPRLRVVRPLVPHDGVVGRRAVPARAHARAQREDPDRQPVERVRHERVDGRGHAALGPALLHPPRVGGRAVPDARGADPRRRPHAAARGRGRRDLPPRRAWCSRATGTIPTPPPRCSTTNAGTTAATTAASRTACSGWRAACATSSSAAARTSTRWRSSTASSSTPTSPTPRSSASTTATLGQEVKAVVVLRTGRRSTRAEVQEWVADGTGRVQGAGRRRVPGRAALHETGKVMKHLLEARAASRLGLDRRRVAGGRVPTPRRHRVARRHGRRPHRSRPRSPTPTRRASSRPAPPGSRAGPRASSCARSSPRPDAPQPRRASEAMATPCQANLFVFGHAPSCPTPRFSMHATAVCPDPSPGRVTP